MLRVIDRIQALPARLDWARVRTLGAGVGAFLLCAWVTMYGKLWCYDKYDAHRMTARAMLTGTLRLRALVTHAGHDEQVYNGAVYTNWGYGVPLLQLPFHALASGLGFLHGFFPDRAIFFLYLAFTMPILWAALHRLLGMRHGSTARAGDRLLVSWAATWLTLNVVLFPFMSTRFVIFEETLAYMVLCELLALSAYIFAMGEWRTGPVVAMGAAAGMGLVVRPIGLLYLGVWGSLVALQRKTRRTLEFASAAAPFVVFWLYSNWVRSGLVLGLGYNNSNPAWEYEMPLLRFGATCGDTPLHLLEAAGRLFGAFFLYVWRTPSDPWLRQCHFDLEERDGTGEPYFGPAVLILLVALVVRLVRRRERTLTAYVPFAAMVILFAMFVRRGEGFAWRYVGDFWPLIVLAVVQEVSTCPRAQLAPLDLRLAKIMFWAGLVNMLRLLVPWQWTGRPEIVPINEVARMAGEYRASRWEVDRPLPSKIRCGDALTTAYNNGLGWRDTCKVATFTNAYLGVTPKAGERYMVRFETEGMTAPSLRVYVNGRIYRAEKRGDVYQAEVTIAYAQLTSPIVMVTMEWAHAGSPPPGKLLSIELA
jgi:hypothetical protein